MDGWWVDGVVVVVDRTNERVDARAMDGVESTESRRVDASEARDDDARGCVRGE